MELSGPSRRRKFPFRLELRVKISLLIKYLYIIADVDNHIVVKDFKNFQRKTIKSGTI